MPNSQSSIDHFTSNLAYRELLSAKKLSTYLFGGPENMGGDEVMVHGLIRIRNKKPSFK